MVKPANITGKRRVLQYAECAAGAQLGAQDQIVVVNITAATSLLLPPKSSAGDAARYTIYNESTNANTLTVKDGDTASTVTTITTSAVKTFSVGESIEDNGLKWFVIS